MENGYATVQELRDHLGDDGARLPLAQLERAITAASRAVDTHTGRRFWRDEVPTVRHYRTQWTDIAWIDDVASTDGIVITTDDNGDGSWATTWTVGDFELWPYDADQRDPLAHAWWRIEALDKAFPVWRGRKSLRVTATFGWSGIPAAVNEATILKAAQLFQRKDAVFGVAGFADFGAVRITRKDPDVIDLLASYVRGWQ